MAEKVKSKLQNEELKNMSEVINNKNLTLDQKITFINENEKLSNAQKEKIIKAIRESNKSNANIKNFSEQEQEKENKKENSLFETTSDNEGGESIRDQKLGGLSFGELFDRFPSDYGRAFTWQNMMKLKQFANWDGVLARKIKDIRLYISIIENKINTKYGKELGTKFAISKYIAFYADQNMPYVFTKMNISQIGKANISPVMMNIPLDRMVTIPPTEIYLLFYTVAMSAAQAVKYNKEGKVFDLELAAHETGKLDEFIEHNEKKIDGIDNSQNKKKAKEILTKYLNEFLPTVCGKDFTRFDNISVLVASQMIDDMSSKELEEFMKITFNIKTLDNEALEKISKFTGKEIFELRTDKLYETAINFWKDPNKEPEALSATQQLQALMAWRTKDDVVRLANCPEGSKGNDQVKRLCQDFADTYMESNGLKPIKLTYKREGELGTYIDAGTSQRININLSKITTITELISTLTHELTHAVESSINKSKGIKTEDGFGLEDNISYNISESKLAVASKEYETLRELNKYCYRLNPNERTARFGEITGLKFMHSMATNEKMSMQLSDTITKFQDYQRRTLEIVEKLLDPAEMSALESRVKSILNNPSIAESDKDMFRERLDYVKKMIKKEKETLSKDGSKKTLEQKSLEEVEKMAIKDSSDLELLQSLSM